MYDVIMVPPVAFIIVLTVTMAISRLLSGLSYKRKGKMEEGTSKAYACGEDSYENRVQVDYEQFFPFAFFFTILHVITLMVTTIPAGSPSAFFIAAVYIIGAITGLFILFRG